MGNTPRYLARRRDVLAPQAARLVAFIGRGAAVGTLFAVVRTAVAIGIARSGAPDGRSSFTVEVAAGVVVGPWLVLLAERLGGSAARATVALTTALFVNLLAVMIEGAAFEPGAADPSNFPLAALLQVVAASMVGLTTVSLVRGLRPRDTRLALPERTALRWLGRYLECVLTYVVLYFVIGAINFTLVTGPFYRSATAGLVVPPPGVVLLVAIVEGGLLPLAVLPLVSVMDGSRRERALIAGATLAILGGVVPLILAPSLPVIVRVASAVEILFQKFPAGVAAAMLLGPDGARPDPRRR